MSGPLDGVRVVDVASLVSGPLAADVLADQGADVIKVEPPSHPDPLRMVGPRRDGISAIFHLTNRGKRAVALDLKDRRGREIFNRLVATADVVVENFRPTVSRRLGIGYEDLTAIRPDLVHLAI